MRTVFLGFALAALAACDAGANCGGCAPPRSSVIAALDAGVNLTSAPLESTRVESAPSVPPQPSRVPAVPSVIVAPPPPPTATASARVRPYAMGTTAISGLDAAALAIDGAAPPINAAVSSLDAATPAIDAAPPVEDAEVPDATIDAGEHDGGSLEDGSD